MRKLFVGGLLLLVTVEANIAFAEGPVETPKELHGIIPPGGDRSNEVPGDIAGAPPAPGNIVPLPPIPGGPGNIGQAAAPMFRPGVKVIIPLMKLNDQWGDLSIQRQFQQKGGVALAPPGVAIEDHLVTFLSQMSGCIGSHNERVQEKEDYEKKKAKLIQNELKHIREDENYPNLYKKVSKELTAQDYVDLLGHDSFAARKLAIYKLRELGKNEAIQAKLIEMQKSDDPEIRMNAGELSQWLRSEAPEVKTCFEKGIRGFKNTLLNGAYKGQTPKLCKE